MISVLIPCHNYNPKRLLAALQKERDKNNLTIEILLWDDASNEQYKSIIEELSFTFNCSYKRFDKNQGRASIRNQLGEAASYENLLFLDCDGLPEFDDFLSNYLRVINEYDLVVGGRSYTTKRPNHSYYLHWKYGSKREVKNAKKRNRNPFFGFQSNNFYIKKDVFLDNLFDENFSGYGHEDTIFGARLKERQIKLLHIDNPVRHLGLQRRSVFLEKSIEAAEQLADFINQGRLTTDDSSMTKFFYRLKKWRLWRLYMLGISMRMPYIHRHLMKKREPSLFLLDLYRLFFFGCKMP